MSLGTTNRDGGKTSESGHLRSIYKALIGEVLSGLAVSQRGAGANMSVDIATGDAVLPRSDATYGHPVFNDAVLNKTVTAADPSNPRRDIVIMYLDYTVTPSTGVSNNTNGVVLTKVVAGTPAGSPADPSAAALQAAAGSGNPYVVLARIRVGAGVTTIGNSVIDDLRRMANGLIQGAWIYDPLYTWAYASANTFTIAGVDVTAQFPIGTKIALYQSGSIKYFNVTGAVFSTNTTITVDGNGTYTLANVPIDKPAFSYANTPQGFLRQLLPDPYNGYSEIGRYTAVGTVTQMTIQNLPPFRYLMTLYFGTPNGSTADYLRFNNDSGNNYTRNTSDDGGAGSSIVNQPGMQYGGSALFRHGRLEILNILAREKAFMGQTTYTGTAGPGNQVIRTEIAGKWANTAALINRIDLVAVSGGFLAGSEFIVLGKN